MSKFNSLQHVTLFPLDRLRHGYKALRLRLTCPKVSLSANLVTELTVLGTHGYGYGYGYGYKIKGLQAIRTLARLLHWYQCGRDFRGSLEVPTMSAKSLTLAKSLHTVSVVVAVARYVSASHPTAGGPAECVGHALAILGYAGAADPYGLAQRAMVILSKDAQ